MKTRENIFKENADHLTSSYLNLLHSMVSVVKSEVREKNFMEQILKEKQTKFNFKIKNDT